MFGLNHSEYCDCFIGDSCLAARSAVCSNVRWKWRTPFPAEAGKYRSSGQAGVEAALPLNSGDSSTVEASTAFFFFFFKDAMGESPVLRKWVWKHGLVLPWDGLVGWVGLHHSELERWVLLMPCLSCGTEIKQNVCIICFCALVFYVQYVLLSKL